MSGYRGQYADLSLKVLKVHTQKAIKIRYQRGHYSITLGWSRCYAASAWPGRMSVSRGGEKHYFQD